MPLPPTYPDIGHPGPPNFTNENFLLIKETSFTLSQDVRDNCMVDWLHTFPYLNERITTVQETKSLTIGGGLPHSLASHQFE